MKFRVHEGGAMDRRSVRPGRELWGSDEDLAADVGVGMDPELLSLTEVCFCSIHRPPLGGIPFFLSYAAITSIRRNSSENQILGNPGDGCQQETHLTELQ